MTKYHQQRVVIYDINEKKKNRRTSKKPCGTPVVIDFQIED